MDFNESVKALHHSYEKNLSKVCLVKIPSEDECCLQVFDSMFGDSVMKLERAVSVSACGGI